MPLRNYYQENREKCLAIAKRYYYKNRSKCLNYRKRYRLQNRQRCDDSIKIWRSNHKDLVRGYRAKSYQKRMLRRGPLVKQCRCGCGRVLAAKGNQGFVESRCFIQTRNLRKRDYYSKNQGKFAAWQRANRNKINRVRVKFDTRYRRLHPERIRANGSKWYWAKKFGLRASELPTQPFIIEKRINKLLKQTKQNA